MKIFVTGATGFIGSHLIRRLVQTDHEVLCLVRPTSRVDDLEKLGVTLVLGDVTNKKSVLEGMIGCDWVMNLANVFTFWERDRDLYRRVNVQGTRNVMEAALETRVKKVIHVSTVAVWGKPDRLPITEECPVGPERFSDYAQTKYEGDLFAWDLHENRGLPLVMIHPVAVVGPGDTRYTGEYIRHLVQRRMPVTALNSSIVTLVHVRDVAEAILQAAEKRDNIGEQYIIGKHRISMRKFNALISEVSGIPLPGISLPDWLTKVNAFLLTRLADLTGKPPLWSMSMDGVRTVAEGTIADGSKAELELGIAYTPLRQAVEDEIRMPIEEVHPYKHRKYSRFKALRPVTIEPENMDSRTGQIMNISRGGLFMMTDRPLEQGMFLTARFSEGYQGRSPELKGKVLRRTDSGMAIQFTDPGVQDIPTLLTH